MKTFKDILTLKSYSELVKHFRGVQKMKILSLLILFVGFIPSFATAAQTDGYLTMVDYACAFGGFCFGCLIWELRYEN